MRYIPIAEAKIGMKLASDLYDSFGRILICSNSELTEKLYEKIKNLGVEGLYIEDKLSAGIVIEPIIPAVLRAKGMKCVKEEDVNGCQDVAKEIVKTIAAKKIVSLDLADLRTFDDYTYSHSVNVAVLTSVIGLGLNLKEKDIAGVVTAGLLHDIGKQDIPAEILKKPDRLTPEEYTIMKNHSIYSYEKIKKRTDLSAQVKQAVLYHHENIDGSGYPNGVNQNQLSLYARILHVADVYDALISKRPYKEPYSPFEAFEYLMGGCGAMFDTAIVNAFLKYVPIYPKGTEVDLSNGQKAIIYDNAGARNMRPIVRIKENGTLMDLWDEEFLNVTIVSAENHGKSVLASEKARYKMLDPENFKKILIVDSDEDNTAKIAKLCDDYIVDCVASANDALAYIDEKGMPDLVLTDVDLPDVDGVDFAKELLSMSKDKLPIAFVTSIHDRDTVIRCRDINPASYILKPYKDLYLTSEVKRIIASRGYFD